LCVEATIIPVFCCNYSQENIQTEPP